MCPLGTILEVIAKCLVWWFSLLWPQHKFERYASCLVCLFQFEKEDERMDIRSKHGGDREVG